MRAKFAQTGERRWARCAMTNENRAFALEIRLNRENAAKVSP